MKFFPPFPYGFIVDAFWTFMGFPLSFDALLLKWKILKYIATLYCIENVSYAEEEGEWLMYCFRWQKCWCWREKCRKEGRGEVRRHRGTGAEVGDICLCLGGTKLPTRGSRKKTGIVSYRSSPDLIFVSLPHATTCFDYIYIRICWNLLFKGHCNKNCIFDGFPYHLFSTLQPESKHQFVSRGLPQLNH